MTQEQYIIENSQREPPILKELRKETYQKTTQPHMLSGVVQGRLLSMISSIIRPQNILEIGTFTGYSALCLAEGLAQNARLTTIDINEELAYFPRKYFQKSTYHHQIDFILGDAKKIIPTLDFIFDLVFIDADKGSYPLYLELIKNNLRAGSVVLVDNVLWSGKVYDPAKNDATTALLRDFNKKIAEQSDFENIILPIRDGINVLRKK